jgi:hypothetical protein
VEELHVEGILADGQAVFLVFGKFYRSAWTRGSNFKATEAAEADTSVCFKATGFAGWLESTSFTSRKVTWVSSFYI